MWVYRGMLPGLGLRISDFSGLGEQDLGFWVNFAGC